MRLTMGAMVLLAAFGIVIALTDTAIELCPSHAGALVPLSLGVAAVVASVTLTLVLWLRVALSGSRWVSAPVFAVSIGLLAGLLTFLVADRVWQSIDFAGGARRSDRDFLIARAYVSRGKGVSYHIRLAEYSIDLSLNRSDYAEVFGDSENLQPTGVCLHAPVEQNDKALRLMLPSSKPLPPGRVGKCR